MEQQNERAMIFYKKIAASGMPLVAALWAAGAPAKVAQAKFHREKEEQGELCDCRPPGGGAPMKVCASKISWGEGAAAE